MATTRGGESEPQPTPQQKAEAVIRSIVAGHEQGAVRRIMLYLIAFVCMGVSFYAPVLVVPALACVALLIATDGSL